MSDAEVLWRFLGKKHPAWSRPCSSFVEGHPPTEPMWICSRCKWADDRHTYAAPPHTGEKP